MKKLLISALIAASLIGCASTNDSEIKKKEAITNETEQIFYNAFVGEIMEAEGQNNNAIKYYERILSSQYEPDYFNKLMLLYYYKNDFIGARNLISNTDFKNIKENHSDYLFVYYIEKEQLNNAVNVFKAGLNFNDSKKSNLIHAYSDYYRKHADYLTFFFQDEDKKNAFLDQLKEKDLKKYNFLKFNIDYFDNNIIPNVELSNYDIVEQEIIKIRQLIGSPNLDILYSVLDSQYVSDNVKAELIDKFSLFFISNKKVDEAKELYDFVEKNKNVKMTNSLRNAESLYYFFTFKHNDALYKLEKIKDFISEDEYMARKAISNYMLGYKSAAKKYFKKVNNYAEINGYSTQYINLFGEEGLKKFNPKEYGVKLLMGDYYHSKNEKTKAIENYEAVLEILNETGESETNYGKELIQVVDLFLLLNQDTVKYLESLENLIETDDNPLIFVNDYIYISTKSGLNKEKVDQLILDYQDDLLLDFNFIDTLAYYHTKNGNPEKAIELYKDYYLIYSHDHEIQVNIAEAYRLIGMKKEYLKHKKYAEMLE